MEGGAMLHQSPGDSFLLFALWIRVIHKVRENRKASYFGRRERIHPVRSCSKAQESTVSPLTGSSRFSPLLLCHLGSIDTGVENYRWEDLWEDIMLPKDRERFKLSIFPNSLRYPFTSLFPFQTSPWCIRGTHNASVHFRVCSCLMSGGWIV